ncbi:MULTISPECIES: DUF503 domain-containing protein [unclassified Pseudofrankia]|uniref:DUF503 domain-containing protein n=1 Tax=unclassified Pseudofrankia TaxID=2994372 RepID=UPI0008DAB267|nr:MULTISPECIES: DUF503 domain-containing protein [unclassified Pseudofrankia]MDT3443132.1 DUF503 domain-containing protein [Pseudofrankia sp. BMG5.37]OHV49974.1 hypothetical protein BCD48_11560 [Pseudofrankia sp. BMG5.36]
MWIGLLSVDGMFGDVHSLKEKRSLVRPVVAELRKRFPVSVAEVDHHDLHRRVKIGIAVVAADRGFCVDVLDGCERLVADRPELEILESRRRLLAEDDVDEAPREAPYRA